MSELDENNDYQANTGSEKAVKLAKRSRKHLLIIGFLIGCLIYGLTTNWSTMRSLIEFGELVASTKDPATTIIVNNDAYKRADALYNESRYQEAEPLFAQALEEV